MIVYLIISLWIVALWRRFSIPKPSKVSYRYTYTYNVPTDIKFRVISKDEAIT